MFCRHQGNNNIVTCFISFAFDHAIYIYISLLFEIASITNLCLLDTLFSEVNAGMKGFCHRVE